MTLPISKTEFENYICRPFCDYFRPGKKEELLCRGAVVVENLVRRQRLFPENFRRLDREEPLTPGQEPGLEAAVCADCPFRAEDCDFKSPHPPADCRPCGGLVLLHRLKNHGLISIPELVDLYHGGQ
jgi:hypothetical protein